MKSLLSLAVSILGAAAVSAAIVEKPEAITTFVKDADAAKLDFQFVNYAGARHAFSNPRSTAMAEKNGMTAMVAYQPAAVRRSWKAMAVFLDEIFGK